nr:hypothetical protein [Tanacetum cinerariifolium]
MPFDLPSLSSLLLYLVLFSSEKGEKIVKLEDLLSKLGTFHSVVVFLEALNQNAVHPLVTLENTVFTVKRLLGCIYYFHMVLLRESAGVDSSIFTKAWVDSAGSEGLKDHSAIDRWQSQAAAADFDFFNRLHVMDEEDTNVNLKQLICLRDGLANESSTSQVIVNRELVMEQKTNAEKAMAVFEFLDLKRKNKTRGVKLGYLKSKKEVYKSNKDKSASLYACRSLEAVADLGN